MQRETARGGVGTGHVRSGSQTFSAIQTIFFLIVILTFTIVDAVQITFKLHFVFFTLSHVCCANKQQQTPPTRVGAGLKGAPPTLGNYVRSGAPSLALEMTGPKTFCLDKYRRAPG